MIAVCIHEFVEYSCCAQTVFRYYPLNGFLLSGLCFIINRLTLLCPYSCSMKLIFSKRSRVFESEKKKRILHVILFTSIIVVANPLYQSWSCSSSSPLVTWFISYTLVVTILRLSYVPLNSKYCGSIILNSMPYFEMVDHCSIFTLLVAINLLQWRYFNHHLNKATLKDSKEK